MGGGGGGVGGGGYFVTQLSRPILSSKFLDPWFSPKIKKKIVLCVVVLSELSNYALVICNHGPPTPGAGRGIAVEMSGVFTFALSPQCGGNTRDLCYIGKQVAQRATMLT